MPARFTIHLAPSFQRDLEGLPAAAQGKILDALKRLEQSPVAPPPRIKKLKGKGIGQWRLEVWPYRVRHRKDIYREQERARRAPMRSSFRMASASHCRINV